MSGVAGPRSGSDLQAGLQEETTEVLRRLIRFDTVNPPGNEREALEYLSDYLTGAGFDCELLGRTPERPNLIARLSADGNGAPGGDGKAQAGGPTLCLLSHVDTGLATPSEWRHDPWSGDLADGCVWGRGALDMKSQGASEIVAAAARARAGWRPRRGTLLVVCVADEEAGGVEGAQWLTRTHPEDKVRCDLLVNEGGGGAFEYDGRRFYGVCCAEKGVFRFKVITQGVAGHASMPTLGDNALLKMAPLIERMAERQPDFDVTDPVRALLRGLGEPADADLRETLAKVRAKDPLQAALVEPLLGVTVVPTRIRASEKINVIPSRAELEVDCRVPPGLGKPEALARIREVLGEEGYELEFLEEVVGNSSPVESELMDHIRAWVAENDPDATCVPTMLPGFTDSRTFRAAFPECVAYGFFPHRHMGLYEAAPLVHSADERIDVRDLGFASRFYYDLVERVLGMSAYLHPQGNDPPKLRLGGMALRNGLLVHGPKHWAAAIRTDAGELQLASGRRPRMRLLDGVPGARGVARLAESVAVLPLVKRALPAARMPFESPGVMSVAAGAATTGAVIRRNGRGRLGPEAAATALSLAPALAALRSGELAAYHGAEHKAIGAYEHGEENPAQATKEHDRCGSHLVTPMLFANLAGVAALRRFVDAPSALASGVVTLAATGVAVELFVWSERHSGTAAARLLRRPGHALQRAIGTREPTPAQLEVGQAALNEILRLDGSPGPAAGLPAPPQAPPG